MQFLMKLIYSTFVTVSLQIQRWIDTAVIGEMILVGVMAWQAVNRVSMRAFDDVRPASVRTRSLPKRCPQNSFAICLMRHIVCLMRDV